jgi:uncharacterized damage-inducible protein DinB
MALTQSVKEAWQANGTVNEVLLEHLTPDMLEAKSPGGGYTVAQQLAHMTGTKKFWGKRLNQDLETLPNLFDERNETEFVAETNLAQIKDVMRQTSQRMLESAESAKDKGELTHTSVEAFLIHMMLHDAHHRGQILLALKTAGHPLPNEDMFWNPLNQELDEWQRLNKG